MPRATVSHDTERFILKSIPVGEGEEPAFVELRTLSFHEMNMRQEMGARMYQETKVEKGRGAKQKGEETVRGYFELMNVAVTEYEFRNCIVYHNLEDENGNLIDFTLPMQAWRLHPKVGQEIGELIDSLNQFDSEEKGSDDADPLKMPLSGFSPGEQTSPFPSTE